MNLNEVHLKLNLENTFFQSFRKMNKMYNKINICRNSISNSYSTTSMENNKI